MRKPELVHVYIPSADGSPGQIVRWQDMMEDAGLCRKCFGDTLNDLFENKPDADDEGDSPKGTFKRIEKLAETAEEQEHQAWCELPFRQLAYNFC